MRDARPSRTAMRVAMRRAAHQLRDVPRVLDDPLALRIIGADAAARIAVPPGKIRNWLSRPLRLFLALRGRLAEDELARAVARGVSQYVILGAGLDTFAYRSPYAPAALRVYEVDHPATQAWKRRKLETAAIAIPASVIYAPVDFERQTLEDGLALAGFDRHAPTFFSWLGVTMYLTDEAIASTLSFVASTPPGGGLVFDYAVPSSSLGPLGRLSRQMIARRVAAVGEPFRSYFDPRALHDRLSRAGFHSIQDLGATELNQRYFAGRKDGLRASTVIGRILSAQI